MLRVAKGAVALEARKPIRVVVVDDHSMFAETLALLLSGDDRLCVVGTAHSARDALQLVAANEIDVVLLDLLLPDAGGVETAQQLRAVRPDAQVILVSGSDADELRPAATAAGAAGYVTKGRLDEGLVETIVELVRGENADDLAGGDRAPHGDR
jgi:DNA-binding NarL/FixJ family response regulator